MSFIKIKSILMFMAVAMVIANISAQAEEKVDLEKAKTEVAAALQAPAGAESGTVDEAQAEIVMEDPAAEDEALVLEDDTEYSYGTVAAVEAESVQVKEYDYDSGADVSVEYVVTATTKYEGANSLKDVAVGDNIEIDYLEKDGKRVVHGMSVEKPFTEEEKSEALAREAEPGQAG